MLLDTLDANLLENLLTGKDTIGAFEGTTRAGQGFSCRLILLVQLQNEALKKFKEEESIELLKNISLISLKIWLKKT